MSSHMINTIFGLAFAWMIPLIPNVRRRTIRKFQPDERDRLEIGLDNIIYIFKLNHPEKQSKSKPVFDMEQNMLDCY